MNYITVDIPSANGKTYPLNIPDNGRVTVAHGAEFPNLPDPSELIREALDNPIGSPKIEDMVKPGNKICIISDDVTRPTPVHLVVAELLPRLLNAGIKKEDIIFVMALGSHRRMTREEMAAKLGQNVVDEYTVLNSEFSDPELLTEVGTSQMGTPIRVFKPAMEADFRISIGNIIPHGCMGWSGGAKILYPGITSEDIVSEFHVMQGFQDGIVYGMDECPVRLAVEEWTKNIGLHYIINTVLDEDMDLYRVVAGHYVQAHRKAVSYAQTVCGVPVDRQPDVILTSAYPIAFDFWQCGKAAYGPARVIREGGELLLLAACTEGVGPHPQMLDYMALENGKEELERRVKSGSTGEDLLTMAVGVSMGRVARHAHMTLITDGLTEEECRRGIMGHAPEAALQQTLEEALAKFDDPFLLILSEGGEIIPMLEA